MCGWWICQIALHINLKIKTVNYDTLTILFLCAPSFCLLPNQSYSEWSYFHFIFMSMTFWNNQLHNLIHSQELWSAFPLPLLEGAKCVTWLSFIPEIVKEFFFPPFLRCGILVPAGPTPPSLCCSSVISLGICPTFHSPWHFPSAPHLPVKFFPEWLLESLPTLSHCKYSRLCCHCCALGGVSAWSSQETASLTKSAFDTEAFRLSQVHVQNHSEGRFKNRLALWVLESCKLVRLDALLVWMQSLSQWNTEFLASNR